MYRYTSVPIEAAIIRLCSQRKICILFRICILHSSQRYTYTMIHQVYPPPTSSSFPQQKQTKLILRDRVPRFAWIFCSVLSGTVFAHISPVSNENCATSVRRFRLDFLFGSKRNNFRSQYPCFEQKLKWVAHPWVRRFRLEFFCLF